jgi:hypothetical protein
MALIVHPLNIYSKTEGNGSLGARRKKDKEKERKEKTSQ